GGDRAGLCLPGRAVVFQLYHGDRAAGHGWGVRVGRVRSAPSPGPEFARPSHRSVSTRARAHALPEPSRTRAVSHPRPGQSPAGARAVPGRAVRGTRTRHGGVMRGFDGSLRMLATGLVVAVAGVAAAERGTDDDRAETPTEWRATAADSAFARAAGPQIFASIGRAVVPAVARVELAPEKP